MLNLATWSASMPEAISNTSPLLYLYRIKALDWLPQLFAGCWTPSAVVGELEEGQRPGYDVPIPSTYCGYRWSIQ